MFRTIVACLVASSVVSLANAAQYGVEAKGPISAGLVASQIADTEWNLRHSSVAREINAGVQDESLSMLDRARAEIAAGNVRTAQELTRRAARPLVEMDAAALAGKHPNDGEHLRDRISVIASIVDGTERIARDKGSSTEFAASARRALNEAEAFAAAGQSDAARDLLTDVYRELQAETARLRSGDLVFIKLPSAVDERAWFDGVRRLEERRQLTDYLIVEAEIVGIDPAPLHAAMAAAETSLNQAADMARQHRWEQALVSLETAYLQHEESWRAVGVEW